jgi:hypothetical protein
MGYWGYWGYWGIGVVGIGILGELEKWAITVVWGQFEVFGARQIDFLGGNN